MQSIARLIALVSSVVTVGCGARLPAATNTGAGDSGTTTDVSDVKNDLPDAGCACASGLCLADGGCATGCLDGSACPSGICLPSRDCFSCQHDSQCADGRRCGTGTCDAVCESEATCPEGWSCCGGRCVDPTRDPLHCGGCAACNTGAFCGQGHCHPSVVSNVCLERVVRVVLDEQVADDEAGKAIGAKLVAACGSAVTLVVGAAPDAGVLDVLTGEPLRPGELLVVGGGSYSQRPMAWLEQQSIVPVVDTSTSSDLQYSQRNGSVICSRPIETISPTHDVFVVQLATAPSGAVVLAAAGYFGEGTTAAAWYVVNTMVPNLASQTRAWYVVEWTDSRTGGAVGQPDALDTWAVLASGL